MSTKQAELRDDAGPPRSRVAIGQPVPYQYSTQGTPKVFRGSRVRPSRTASAGGVRILDNAQVEWWTGGENDVFLLERRRVRLPPNVRGAQVETPWSLVGGFIDLGRTFPYMRQWAAILFEHASSGCPGELRIDNLSNDPSGLILHVSCPLLDGPTEIEVAGIRG